MKDKTEKDQAGAIDRITLPLFVPGDRPERFAKAMAAGADAVIVDLEDAVAPDAKERARAGLAEALAPVTGTVPVLVRINARGTPWHAGDLAACAGLPLAGLVLPKAESGADCVAVREETGLSVVALVESARGLRNAEEIAMASRRLAFGSIDFAADLGIAHERDVLLPARFALAMAARLAGQAAPIDGVTTALREEDVIADDCRHAVAMGFGGKLIIHPAQIEAARKGCAPSQGECDWARRVLSAVEGGAAAIAVDGAMVDAPVIARARRILERAAATV
ncbi:CoA ester lyase [Stappia sp. MMSF_3263]|uniref:HpcH/HpaI aldolase/citrate lyase family protein n=1 Tax=Stappia sp. MMSF_3263 TaxID=3046693 RepID=UPI00273D84F1|nr:CoA ester lyase [Stappia sp. MMSF_3263]